jgi:hypothetical protein
MEDDDNGCGFASPTWYAWHLDLCWAMAGRLMTSIPSLRQCHWERQGGQEYGTEPNRSPPLYFAAHQIKFAFLLNLSLLIVNAAILFLPCDGADVVHAGLAVADVGGSLCISVHAEEGSHLD